MGENNFMIEVGFSVAESCPELTVLRFIFLNLSEWWLSLLGLPGFQAKQSSIKQKGNTRVNILFLGGFQWIG